MYRRISVSLSGAVYRGTEGVILQQQKNDCGPAALAMVLNDAGVRIHREEILQQIVMSENGTTMEELRRFAESHGVILEGWKLSIGELSGRKLPALLFIRQEHFVTVDSIVHGEIFFRDPAVGCLKMREERFQRMWNGYALITKEK
ncbi:MAG: hypothetical protein KA247_07530 [Bacteroidetes bacterium]|nr:hypothetical protein [Bacteroidota bacterium]